ncbi:MAG TPA: TonB-dependent receptor [Candidatus Angelobacter sp.]|nr:TonB-dependent receptor [Candidatus Angelobacter sp.]
MNRKLRDILVLVATCLTLLWCIPSFGQVLKGSISGTAVDQQGAVVSGAQVKATDTATGAVHTTTTDSSGLFRFNLIPAGEYKIEVSAPNFKTSVQNNVIVSAGRDSGLGTVKLTVGETNTTVEVTADAPLIETTQAQVTNTFSGVQLQTFAGVQENEGLDNLALFVPGVSSVRDNSFSNTNGGQGFSVNGLRGRNNDQEIDGQNNNDNSVGGPGLFVTDPEFVSQYVLVTNQFGPEYGRNSGSVVNIVTKSGGNAWRGSVFGSENNSILNSLNNFDKNPDICGTGPDGVSPGPNCLKKPNRLNDEFGGFTIGGPWIKNKLFFFGGFDEELVSQKVTFNTSLLTPTPAGIATLQGCFPGSASLNALTKFGPYAISGGNPQPNGTPVTGVVSTCPAAQFAGVSRTVPQPDHIFDWIVRQDLQLGSDTITGRYIFNRNNFFNGNDNGAAGYFFNVPALSQVALLSWTHNISAHMVNEARGSFGRLNVEFGGSSISGAASPVAGQLDQAPANISFNASAQSLGFGPATNLPQQRIVNTWQAQDNWNYVMGKHQLKAGVNWTYQRSPNIFLPNINGAYRFSNWRTFALDTPNRIRIASGPSLLDFREYDTFLYGGDDFKVTQHLTVQLGVTWSYYGQPANLFNNITVPRESNAATALWAATEPVGADVLGNTFSNPGASIPLAARTEPIIPAPKTSFGPSVGFTYSPQWGGFLTGNGKTVLRGGYRMLYDPPFYNIYLNISTSAPMTFLNTVPAPGTHPLPAVPIGPNVRSSLASSIQKGVFDPREFAQTHVTPNFGPDKVHTWTLGLERELTKNAAIEARYVGNHAYNLFQTLDGNPKIDDLKKDFPNLVPAGLTPCASPLFTNAGAPFGGADPRGRLDCTQGVVRTRANSGYSNYQAAQVEFRANNLFKQLTIRSAYTFSKTLDNVSEIFSTFGGGNSVFFAQNPAQQVNGRGEYSFSGLDYPHQWSMLFYEQLPFFKEQHGFMGHLLGGWGLSGNYIVASGQRYSPIQASALAALTANGDYYDFGYIANFAGVDTAHPFLGNLGAPSTAVGIFAADACALFGDAGSCGAPASSLLSFNSLNKNGTVVNVTNQQVRFIMNGGEAQSIFGTPFGNSPRNPVQDAKTTIGNASIIKDIKLGEHVNFQFHASLLNVFNQANFASVDPILEDAGLTGAFTGFGDPTQTPSVSNGAPPTRRIIFGGKLTF